MRWIYKTVHYELKKEGILGSAFLDENEIEESLNEYGKAGWELVSMMEISDGIMAIFKQPSHVAGKVGIRRRGKSEKENIATDEKQKVSFEPVDEQKDESGNVPIGVIRIE